MTVPKTVHHGKCQLDDFFLFFEFVVIVHSSVDIIIKIVNNINSIHKFLKINLLMALLKMQLVQIKRMIPFRTPCMSVPVVRLGIYVHVKRNCIHTTYIHSSPTIIGMSI